ncbi:MAG: hypothetical protein HZA54_13155 [Planctomycetes bacterium]|nr:hypothetical protein [Planctomycetota bacterium]
MVKSGRECLVDLVRVDLEPNREWPRVFQGTLSAREILPQLELLVGQRITPGKTRLFLAA